jgi:hypothetical protein
MCKGQKSSKGSSNANGSYKGNGDSKEKGCDNNGKYSSNAIQGSMMHH